MAITCTCPKCRKSLAIDEKFAGQPMRCPLCTSMFQAPRLGAAVKAGAIQANPPTESAGLTPPWEQAGKDPQAPEWPWLVGKPGGGGAYDWRSLSPDEAIRLAPGWHRVRVGLALLPSSLTIVFITLALARLFWLIAEPSPQTQKLVFLIVIPITAFGALAVGAGKGLCCLVPPESKLRAFAFGAAGAFLVGSLAAMFYTFLWFVLSNPSLQETRPGLYGFLKVITGIASIVLLLSALGTGAAFLLFMRGVARVFANRRLAQHLLWYLIFFGLSPLLFLFVYFLFSAMGYVLGANDAQSSTALNIVLNVAEFTLAGVVLAGFLLMVRDIRSAIERAILPRKL